MDAERTRRIGENEALFRNVNEAAYGFGATLAATRMSAICECGDVVCTERFDILPSEYEAVRDDSTFFAIKPGHDVPEVESVVDQRDGYWVVRKREGLAAQVAEQTDPRN